MIFRPLGRAKGASIFHSGGARLTDHEVWKIERSKKKHSQNNVLVMQITEEYFTFSGDMFYIELQKRHSISEPLQRNRTIR